MTKEKFTWVPTHNELVKIISKSRNQQPMLIDLLRKAGVVGLHDEAKTGKRIDLQEIDPFSFFCFIYKYGTEKRVQILETIAKELAISIPNDDFGVPSVNAQKVCLFPFKHDRKNNEINRLWNLFEAALNNNITDEQFDDVLKITGTGKTKLTEGLYNILPEKYFPINGPAKPYIKEVLGIDPAFNTYTEYLSLLEKIKSKITIPFYELSYEAWKWNDEKNVEYYVIGSRYGENNNIDVSQKMIEESIVAVGFAKNYNLEYYFNKPIEEIKLFLESKAESQGSKNALKLFLSLKAGDKIAIKASGSPKGNSPFLSIIAIAEVVAKNGKIYEYHPNGLIHTINVKYLKTNVYKEFPYGGYGATIHKIKDEEQIAKIFEDNYMSTPNSYFERVKSKFTSIEIETYFDFLRMILEKFKLQKGNNKIVFSVRKTSQGRLVFTIGQRYCLTLEKDKSGCYIGVISTKKINKTDFQFDGPPPTPYYCLLNIDQFQKLDKTNIISAIEKEIKRSSKSGYLKSNNLDFEKYVYQTQSAHETTKETMEISLNTILYGPPGTGKTFALKNEYMKYFTASENAVTKEEYLSDIIQHCSWWQVIALVLRQLGKSKVADIANHEYITTKSKFSNTKTITQTIWAQLLTHTIENSETVNITKRQPPLIFNKSQNSIWEILDDEILDQAPEIIELEKKISDYSLTSNKEIKRYEFVTFHQSYSYEDFIEGIKPELNDTDVAYKIEEGVFQKLCNRARNDENNKYAIFIDEINRGNISSIFGELITLIEVDKREKSPNEISVTLPYSQRHFSVPKNLYIIGTMNTADRSVEALDTALRRRFSFLELNPEPEKLSQTDYACQGIDLTKLLTAINSRIEKLLDKDYCIGHSYFMTIKDRTNPVGDLRFIFKNNILPLLQEYFYGDWGKIMLVLGDGFVTKTKSDVIFLSKEKYDNYEEFDEKPIYKFTESSAWTLDTFRSIYE